jgi:hypothetical protein
MEQQLAPYTRTDIAFPSQIEVRVNGDEVKANFKGLKNKPGSTRPVDITNLLRITPANYRNNLLITYALTQKASRQEVSYPLSFVSCRARLTANAEVSSFRLYGAKVFDRRIGEAYQATKCNFQAKRSH